ncbi:toll/interleukin-1 receptor domain-containing protein [Paraburkholderia strydomiana]|uniref:toll/interleukin-1 receptor domain-containing protein n=1 Tax=Paraburkholderia strydomiana TaxID=1245417 RepID=UPI001BE59C26|nr:toll/interleukin-1 receptor domain-containing protein [Paraburkholderia strydomiana]
MTNHPTSTTDRVPAVFVSYSHDSPDHRRWVFEFASRLVNSGINVMIDQWDVGPGHDLAKYMEQAVSAAERVLMVCTETDRHRAAGGVCPAGGRPAAYPSPLSMRCHTAGRSKLGVRALTFALHQDGYNR